MSAEADGSDLILDAIAGQEQVAGLVIGYVVVATFLDADGESRIFSDTFENQKCHQTLGLLAFATAIETRKAADAWNAE